MNPTQSVPQYPPPPTADSQSENDFVQTATAALSSATPHASIHDSQQHAHLPNGFSHAVTPTQSTSTARKRKAAIPGSRGVANLTPDQLAKKRANDREAQRAIRERTKTTIDKLEKRISELESQQPYQEMQRALAERDRALAECEELKSRLEAVAGIVGSRDIGQTGLNELAALTAQQSPLPPLSTHATSQHPVQTQLSGQHEAIPQQQNLHPDLRSPEVSNASGSPNPG